MSMNDDDDFIELCKSGNAVGVEQAINNGADVNAKDHNGITALMSAAYNGRADVAEVLIKYGADVNAKNDFGKTALILAKENNHTAVVELLRKHGTEDTKVSSLLCSAYNLHV